MTPPVVLTIAGSDSSGGAGIQADLKTFAAIGVYGASAITALTAQNTKGVFGIHPVPPEFVAAQIKTVTSDLEVAAVKIGMLATAQIVETVAHCLKAAPVPITVFDPVMIATSGDPLIPEDAIHVLKDQLFPLATLVTPNRAEAAKLTGRPPFETDQDMEAQAREIIQLGCRAVFLKGGHANRQTARDILATHESVFALERPMITTKNNHGTGCTLAAAAAAYLGQGQELPDAVMAAKDYVWQALNAARDQNIGHGNGPLDHAFSLRKNPS